MKKLWLQTIMYERAGNAPEVLSEIETPRYPDAEVMDKLKILFWTHKQRRDPGEALRFMDENETEIVRYGAWDEMEGRPNA